MKYFKVEKKTHKIILITFSVCVVLFFCNFLTATNYNLCFLCFYTKAKIESLFQNVFLTPIIKSRQDLKYVCAKKRKGSRENVGQDEVSKYLLHFL